MPPKREFFAYLPILTRTGWAWLCDVKEVWLLDPTHQPGGRWQRHYEKLFVSP